MPYPYRISVEYTDKQNSRVKTYEVDGQHSFVMQDALAPEHRALFVECTGPTGDPGQPISRIVLKLKP